MMKKSTSHEGTDTEGESPKKRPKPIPKPVEAVPLVPTHGRTTRFKETMKKEARSQAAKKKRIEAKDKKKPRQNGREPSSRSPSSVRRKIVLSAESENLSEKSTILNGKSRSSSSSRSSESSLTSSSRPRRSSKPRHGSLVKDAVHRASALRPRGSNMYKEGTSESDSDSRSSIEDPLDPMQMVEDEDISNGILQTVADIIEKVVENGSRTPKKTTKRCIGTPPIQTPTKVVPIKIEDDLKVVFVNDLGKTPVKKNEQPQIAEMAKLNTVTVASEPDPPATTSTPQKGNRKKNRIPDKATIENLINKQTIEVNGNGETDAYDASIQSDAIITSKYTPEKTYNPEFASNAPVSLVPGENEAKLTENGHITAHKIDTEKKGNRTLKRLETDLVEANDVSPSGKRRNSFELAFRMKSQPLRINLPLEVKISAIERVESGDSLAVVARELDTSITSLSAWLMRKAEIRSRWQLEKLATEESKAEEAFQHEILMEESPRKKIIRVAEETLLNELLESSDSEGEPAVKPLMSPSPDMPMDMAGSLGLVKVTTIAQQRKLPTCTPTMKVADTENISTKIGQPTQAESSVEPQRLSHIVSEKITSENSPDLEALIIGQTESTETSSNVKANGNIPAPSSISEKVPDLPLTTLFKSMKSAFTKPQVKRKSMESLANSLLEKAVAKSLNIQEFSKPASDPPSLVASIPSKPSLSSVPSNGQSIPHSNSRPPTGLAMIGASYCSSSDDEL